MGTTVAAIGGQSTDRAQLALCLPIELIELVDRPRHDMVCSHLTMKFERDKDQHYDVWLHWNPTDRCNLSCAYCFDNSSKRTADTPSIDIESLITTLEKTKKTFRISFTGGGEPFLVPNIADACAALTTKHFISLNTNLVLGGVERFAGLVPPERVLFVIASLHIEELERLNLLDRYIRNFKLCQKRGFNIGANIVAFPSLLGRVEKYRSLCDAEKIPLKFDPFVGEYEGKVYPDAYTREETEALGLALEERARFRQQGQLCNAGYNVGVIGPNGEITPCFQIHKIMGNIYEGIELRDKLIRCPFRTCECPLNTYDPYLFEKALEATDSRTRSPLYLMKYRLRGYARRALGKR